ncbi:MAG: AAA family ATPase, partial [Muribaculaceae bacterium]|nr:AAA family ATPase [Muribaculaceae bacterium]
MAYKDLDNSYTYIESNQVEEPESVYIINKELNLANRIMEETSVNLFLTGKAGTGKTTFLRRLRQTSPKRMIVLAPTGVAAINAEGATIHSFFQLPFAPYIPGKGFIGNDSRSYSFSKEKRRIIAALDILVIDEISMVRPDTLDAIDAVLRRFRNPTLPFGGVQLLLIGDLRQLAPVLKDNERELLSPYYQSEYFFDSIALKQSGFVTIELSTVYRQKDLEFINILNAVRDGMLTNEIFRKLNSRYLPGFNPPADEKYIRLTTHNRLADDINNRELALIPKESVSYKAAVQGNFPPSSFPADEELKLKIGAQVMFIKNDSGLDRLYYNGMIGEVTGLTENNVIVKPADGRPPISVGYVEWENTKYIVNEQSKEITQITEGTFSQLPLRLAWAITIHKSQGLTFDHAIIDAGYSFAPGQTYVALSRCRSLEGLVLGQPIPVNAVITDNKVNSFIESASRNRPDEITIDRLRSEYTRHTLAELFDFRGLKVAFDDF